MKVLSRGARKKLTGVGRYERIWKVVRTSCYANTDFETETLNRGVDGLTATVTAMNAGGTRRTCAGILASIRDRPNVSEDTAKNAMPFDSKALLAINFYSKKSRCQTCWVRCSIHERAHVEDNWRFAHIVPPTCDGNSPSTATYF